MYAHVTLTLCKITLMNRFMTYQNIFKKTKPIVMRFEAFTCGFMDGFT